MSSPAIHRVSDAIDFRLDTFVQGFKRVAAENTIRFEAVFLLERFQRRLQRRIEGLVIFSDDFGLVFEIGCGRGDFDADRQ